MRPPLCAMLAALCALAAPPAAAETPRWVGVPEPVAASERDRERAARRSLADARALRRDGRLDDAETVARRGLATKPDSAPLQRELARVLEAQGRPAAAAAARARADSLAPPPGPLPREPLASGSRGVRVVLVAPDPETRAERRPRAWPEGEVAAELEARLRLRLPRANVAHAHFASAPEALAWLSRGAPRAVLSLRVDRIYCGDTLKDGRFGLAALRVAAERPGSASAGPVWARVVVEEPRLAVGCRRELIARALEQALALPEVRQALAAGDPAAQPWSGAAARNLFPSLGLRIEAELARGRALLRQGRLAEARRTFAQAARIDPEDRVVRSYERDAAASLALSRELARRRGEDGERVAPRTSRAERAALEASLAAERQRREELLAALAVLNEEARLPDAAALRALSLDTADSEGFGARLARRRAGGSVVARASRTPDGELLARYYFPEGDALPVVREEDRNRDGAPDRWIAYVGDRRAEVFEDANETGRPDVRMVYGGAGEQLARVEIDRDGDDRPERVLHYSGGSLSSEAHDSDADGQLDTFDHFASVDGEQELQIRDEDRDGDGVIDVRSLYRNGKLIRKLLGAETLEE